MKLMKSILSLFIFSFISQWSLAQKSVCSYEEQMKKQGLVEVQKVLPEVFVQLKYATTDNFMKKNVYGCLTHAYLQKETLEMLGKAQKYLQKTHPGLHFLIYDAARPLAKQWDLWNTLSDMPPKQRSNYVADPAIHSIHNYGSAIDLTLADANQIPLDMGTSFDFFGELAYPKKEQELLNNGKLSERAYQNRLKLRNAMKAGGFMPIEYEWWHFNAFSRQDAKQKFKVVE
ncbi:peptidase M15 [Sandaracinomonas limnophila]|uniref:D-alanyl-D-alanine dipeptidase n=2 Tax=Sandaracinomonas limnophila TaxID=1862386 RepID=A0A437PPX5_9BACT|nr:peptidase M15 [Sandaracinomonas limnophila]